MTEAEGKPQQSVLHLVRNENARSCKECGTEYIVPLYASPSAANEHGVWQEGDCEVMHGWWDTDPESAGDVTVYYLREQNCCPTCGCRAFCAGDYLERVHVTQEGAQSPERVVRRRQR